MMPKAEGFKKDRLKKALLERIAVHEQDGTLPTSARFLFYELEGKSDEFGILVSKEKKGARRPDQDLIVALTELREEGLVPWEAITDETRSVLAWNNKPTVAEQLKDAISSAKIDPWKDADRPPVVICESRSLAGVLGQMCYRYGVTYASTNGQSSGFVRTRLAPTIKSLGNGGVLILYCGDLDKGGAHIEANTRKILEEDCACDLEWERLMLTDEQVSTYDLPFILKTDKRFSHSGEHLAWECEALSQKLIVDLLEERLNTLLHPATIEQIEKQEIKERAAVMKKLKVL
jgi:hypothetical protein